MKTAVDSKRGCGWRAPGALYLRADPPFEACGRLPIPLTVCPCCGEGIKQARGFTWVTNEIVTAEECPGNPECGSCLLAADNLPRKLGLIWVGAQFYPTPFDFLSEASSQGISKRIGQIPNDLVLGGTVILVAHPKVTIRRPELGDDPAACQGPAISSSFLADRIEYVATGEETDDDLAGLEKRGITPVMVEQNETRPLALS